MSKIIGNTVGMGLPKPNLMQTDPSKGDYVKGKEEFMKQGAGLTETQTQALHGLLRVCAFTQSDVSAQYNAFLEAFGLDGDIPDGPGDSGGDAPDVPGGDGFDSGLIDLTRQTVVDYGGATHNVINAHTMVVTRPTGSGGNCYSYIIVNGLTPGQSYELYIQPLEGGGMVSVYGNKTPNATDDSGYGSKIQSNGTVVGTYDPKRFTLPVNEYGILIYCYSSVAKLRLVEVEA